jgi:hypothetical protein
MISELLRKNSELTGQVAALNESNNALNSMYQEQTEAREARISALERILKEHGIETPPVLLTKRHAREHERSTTLTGIPIITVGGEYQKTGSPEDTSLPLEDPQQYINKFLMRIKIILSQALIDANGDYETFFDILDKGYAGRSKATRDDMYKLLKDLGASDSASTELHIRMLQEDILYRSLAHDLEGAVSILEVRAQGIVKRKQAIDQAEEQLSKKLKDASEILKRANEVEEGLREIALKTEEVRQVLADKSRIAEERKRVEQQKAKFKEFAASLKSFNSRVTKSADENRALLTRAYGGFTQRLDSIAREYGAKGAAIIPLATYTDLLKDHVKDPVVVRGADLPEQRERLERIVNRSAYDSHPVPQRDDVLGCYFVTTIKSDNGTAVAHFCVFGLEESGGKIDPERLAKLSNTAKSVRESILQNYSGMHFLSETGPSGYLKEKVDSFFDAVMKL